MRLSKHFGQHKGGCQTAFWQQSWPTVYINPWPKSAHTSKRYQITSLSPPHVAFALPCISRLKPERQDSGLMCVPRIFHPFATSNHERCAMGITQSMRTDSIPTSMGVRRALISQLLFCLFLSLSRAHLPISPQRTAGMCWIWLTDDTNTFFRPAGTYGAGMCMLSSRKITIWPPFFFIWGMWDGWMSNGRG